MNARITAYLKSEGVMKKFLQIFALCALCVLAAPMVFAAKCKEPIVVTATKNDIGKIIRAKDDITIKLVGDIDDNTATSLWLGFWKWNDQLSLRGRIELDMSKTTGTEEFPVEAFDEAYNLRSIILPSNVKSIGKWVFRNCGNLKAIIIDENNEYYKSIDGVLYSNDGSTLVRYPPDKTGKSFLIPNTVKNIEDGAFYACDNLAEIIVDENNENYKAVDGVLYNKDTTLLIQYPANKMDKSFVVPNGIESISIGAFAKNGKLKTLIIPEGVKCIEDRTFISCSGLKSITIPDSVETIGNFAFRYCWSLKKIIIPDGVKTIGDFAFDCCSHLEIVKLPDTLKTIGYGAFSKCESLKSITIPAGIENINSAFETCKSLKTINYKGSKEQWNAIDKEPYWNKGCPSTMKINFNYQE